MDRQVAVEVHRADAQLAAVGRQEAGQGHIDGAPADIAEAEVERVSAVGIDWVVGKRFP